MGSHAVHPDWENADDESDDTAAKLGDVLSGRLADIEVDSVAAVREQREQE